MSPFLTPVGVRKKNVYRKVSVGLKCVRMTYAVFTLGIFTAVTEFTYRGKFLVNVNIN